MVSTFPYYPNLAINNHEVAYHYTSPDVFKTIIMDHTLRFSRVDCMNDYIDGKIVEELYPKALQEMLTAGVISNDYYNYVENIDPRAYRIVNEVKIGDHAQYEFEEAIHFVCCFSENQDALQMWQYYSKGGNYEGYNIGFEMMSLFGESAFIKTRRVIYKQDQQMAMIKHAIECGYNDSVKNGGFVNVELLQNQLSFLNCFFKKECFAGEQEIRIIVLWTSNLSETLGKYGKEGIVQEQYRINHGMMIPYFDLKYNQDAIKAVTIGPITSNKDESAKKNREVVEEFLRGNLKQGVEVQVSQIPLRY